MTLPSLTDWEVTREALHQAALVLSPIKKLGVDPDEKFFHHVALHVAPEGLTTGTTASGGLLLNFMAGTVSYIPLKGQSLSISLAGHTQISLMDAILKTMEQSGMKIEPDRGKINHDSPLHIDLHQASDYASVLNTVYRALSVFHGSLSGDRTEPVVFPHHFDLSFLWFNGTAENEQQPHVNFGFSPGDDSIPRPYLYGYAWDGKGFLDLQVSEPLHHDPNYTGGVVLYYDDLRVSDNPGEMLKSALESIQKAASPLW